MSNISKDVATSTSKAIELTGTAINELINIILHSVGMFTWGVTSFTDGAGNVTDNIMGNKIGVKTTQIFKDAGVTAKQASDSLGKVVKTIPLVGGTVAYVVERGGNGIYHVVVSVGNIIGNSSKKIGKVVKKTTDLIVFTLSSVNDEIQEIGKEIASIITNLTERKQSGGSRKNKRRSSKSNGRKSSRNSSKRRGGVRSVI